MIKLLGRNNSVHTQKVMWCSAEISLPVERLDVGGAFGGNTDPKYLAMNPNGTVPTLIDGDFVLWESNAIVRYLAQKYGKAPWQPRSLEQAGLAGQWMDWTTNAVIPPVRTLFSILMRTKPEDRDMGQVRIARRQGIGVFAILNAHLETREFVTGDEPTIGDIPVGVFAYRWFNMPIERPEMKPLEAWYKRLVERPGYRQHVMLPLT